nr:hypothetical protein [uncultured Acidovorax sp.]
MSTVVQTPAARIGAPRPAIDRDGMHWQRHGEAVGLASRSNLTGPASIGTMAVHSMRSPRHVLGLAHVMVETVQEPFTLAARMRPEQARQLAAALMAAADCADAVQAGVEGRGPVCRSSK